MFFPKFWLESKSKKSSLLYFLLPISGIWWLATKILLTFSISKKMPLPIICVGNITVGGNGKTPTALAISTLIKELGYNPHIVSRGYKGQFRGPHLVETEVNTFSEVGDEPLMMSLYSPTWIGRSRRDTIKSAFENGADIIIMDDGFQNNSVKKDLSVLVVDVSVVFGNGLIIPAGPLREPIKDGFKRADLLVTVGTQNDQINFKEAFSNLDKPIQIEASLQPRVKNINWSGKTVVAFAGISHPSKFFNLLEELGANIISRISFPNHEPFKKKALENLIEQSNKENALLVTTEKDSVRIPKNLRKFFHVLNVDLKFQNENLILDKLKEIL